MSVRDDARVKATHGSGGPAMRALIEDVLLGEGAHAEARAMDDGAVLRFGERWLVLTTDAHVVHPIFFPGGDIGRLAVSGVVNDLAMMGACEVLGLTSAVIVEEGFPIESLRRVHASMAQACHEANAPIVTGDTKVMGRGELDGLVLSTSGVGVAERIVRSNGLRPGDALVVTGTLADHGLAVLCARHGLGLQGDLRSDVAPLNGLVCEALHAAGDGITAMKDPTRGGVSSALHELAARSGVGVVVRESALPMSDAARAAAELLGIDPLVVANEGKALLGVRPNALDAVLAALHAHPLGRHAAHIGTAKDPAEVPSGVVLLDTGFGQRRLTERDGEPLPRIC